MIVVPWTREVATGSDKWLDLGYVLKVEPTKVADGANYTRGSRMTSNFLLSKIGFEEKIKSLVLDMLHFRY